jgi:hypothetical protein
LYLRSHNLVGSVTARAHSSSPSPSLSLSHRHPSRYCCPIALLSPITWALAVAVLEAYDLGGACRGGEARPRHLHRRSKDSPSSAKLLGFSAIYVVEKHSLKAVYNRLLLFPSLISLIQGETLTPPWIYFGLIFLSIPYVDMCLFAS